jgi:hypothetical protein
MQLLVLLKGEEAV